MSAPEICPLYSPTLEQNKKVRYLWIENNEPPTSTLLPIAGNLYFWKQTLHHNKTFYSTLWCVKIKDWNTILLKKSAKHSVYCKSVKKSCYYKFVNFVKFSEFLKLLFLTKCLTQKNTMSGKIRKTDKLHNDTNSKL